MFFRLCMIIFYLLSAYCFIQRNIGAGLAFLAFGSVLVPKAR